MNTTSLASALLLLLPAGCALLQPSPPDWRIQPVVSVRHGSDNARAYYDLGRYYLGQRRLAQAESAFRRAIELDDRQLDAYNALGALYAERGELERALGMFSKVTATAPDAAYLHNNLGYALLLLGRHDEAEAAIRRALTLEPGFERAWDNLARLAAARGDARLAEKARTRHLEGIPEALDLVTAREMAARPAPRDERAPQRASAGKIRNASGFQLIAANREVQAENGRVQLAAAPAAPARPAPVGEPAQFRLELTNGNGVTGFATRLGRLLKSEGIAVSRITNQKPYSVLTTTIEYQPGYEVPARSLAAQTGIPGNLVEAKQPRRGTDIRMVLGRDAADRASARAAAPDAART